MSDNLAHSKLYRQRRTQLRKLLIHHFDSEDLQELCFDLGIDFDSMSGGNKAAKVRAIISHMEKRLLLSELVRAAVDARPNVEWPMFSPLTEPVSLDGSGSRTEPDDITGIPTGFTDLDGVLGGGLHKADLISVSARPGIGKSSLVTTIALVAARKHQKRVGFFSLQLSNEQLVKRIAAAEARVDLQQLLRHNLKEHEWLIYNEAVGRLQETSLAIIDTAFITPSQLRAECHRLRIESGLDLLVVDGLELMQPERTNQDIGQAINEFARSLKNLARELNVPVLITSQLKNTVDRRASKRPCLGDLPGNLDQFADIVMLVYRDEYYYPDTTERPNIVEVTIAKHHNGPTGTVDLYWHSRLNVFRNLVVQAMAL